ncbi:hypothetical protein T265_11043 [Opisthorchis viverrini]|uniref:Uncharacterized protein n=1 Tax=Opisthorchis viverrini TaxID=6198 RepID=A0A074ZAX8_OPIVI|nr:hypothetical protein T265_11043 [Opisthorchis viverrini]KER20395.1 hypothetical protein T265_11043 [Opisthorchis viverrini]
MKTETGAVDKASGAAAHGSLCCKRQDLCNSRYIKFGGTFSEGKNNAYNVERTSYDPEYESHE